MISIVIPVKNEAKNVTILYKKISKVLNKFGQRYEIIYVDDGSTDGTFKELKKLKVKTIKFRKNFGQSAAMDAGFKHCKGKYIISMDGDLQNDPNDIPKMIDFLEKKDLDVVCGWRYNRKDSFEKKIFSKFANIFRNMLIKDPVHDSGCSLRIYKKECFENFHLMGEMHRYIPALLRWKGFQIGEIKVHHHARKFGDTKYNLSRVFKGFLDLFIVWFWRKFSSRPVHIFGALGLLLSGFGGFVGLLTIYYKITRNIDLSDTLLPIIAIFSIILGVQFFVSGIIADILVKTYFNSEGSTNYSIKEIIDNENL